MSRTQPIRSIRSKIKSPQALRRIVGQLHQSGAKTVFTNGCFDILHSGHVTYLERARKRGTHLVVAVNSDDSVKLLKGKDRPINPLKDRMKVIASLESVNYVTWFEESTPLQLIISLRPRILVKGGDWKAGQIIGAEEVPRWGGKVFSLPYIEGRSTTEIIQRVSRAKE